MFEAEAAGFRPQFGDRHAGGIVDEDLRFRKVSGRPAQSLPVFLVQIPGIDPMGVDPGFAAQKPLDQLFLAHFQAEDADGFVFSDRNVLGDVEAKAGFSQVPAARPR